jgi:hypothetical protein
MQAKMVKDLASNMTTAGGRTPTEDDVLSLVREIQRKNLAPERIRALAGQAIDPRTNKLNITTLRNSVGGGALAQAGEGADPPTITKQAPKPKSGGGFFVGPIEGPPTGDKAPPSSGVGPGFRF